MIETQSIVICDRCEKTVGQMSTGPFTSGYYTRGGWSKFLNPGEEHVCDECMWADPRYIAVYGVVQPVAYTAKPKEFRYGDEGTIHRTGEVNVETDSAGTVVSVWFRCMPLPFDQHKVGASRAEEMQRMYARQKQGSSIKAVVFDG